MESTFIMGVCDRREAASSSGTAEPRALVGAFASTTVECTNLLAISAARIVLPRCREDAWSLNTAEKMRRA